MCLIAKSGSVFKKSKFSMYWVWKSKIRGPSKSSIQDSSNKTKLHFVRFIPMYWRGFFFKKQCHLSVSRGLAVFSFFPPQLRYFLFPHLCYLLSFRGKNSLAWILLDSIVQDIYYLKQTPKLCFFHCYTILKYFFEKRKFLIISNKHG